MILSSEDKKMVDTGDLDMKIKIIMDNGNEYITERFSSIEELSENILYGPSKVSYFSTDDEKKNYLNAAHVASFEILD